MVVAKSPLLRSARTGGSRANSSQHLNTPIHERIDREGCRMRVRLPIHIQQLCSVDVRVALRRAEARVAEQLLDDAQVGAALQQVRREGVPQRVRTDAIPLGD